MKKPRPPDTPHSGPGHTARGYSWPPFEKGNQFSRTHGIGELLQRKPAKPEQLEAIEAIYAGYLEEFPFLHEADTFELRHLSRLRYMIEQLSDYRDRVIVGEARVRLNVGREMELQTGIEAWYASGLEETLHKQIVAATQISKNLGLNPSGRFAIAKDLYTAKRLARQKGLGELRAIGGGLRRGEPPSGEGGGAIEA